MSPAAASKTQCWSAKSYSENARFVADLANEVLDWLAPKPAERILDLGCGDGVLTAGLVKRGCLVTGVDSSQSLLDAALARGLDARLMDGEKLAFNAEFDAVFSNAALHWMTDADAVVAGVRRALKAGGRFVAEFGGQGNVAAIATALRALAHWRKGDIGLAGPWFFPSPGVYRDILEAGGFTVKRIGLYPRPTPLKTGMEAWLRVFSTPFFAQFGADEKAVLSEAVELLRPSLCDAHGNWSADYVRLRVEAVTA